MRFLTLCATLLLFCFTALPAIAEDRTAPVSAAERAKRELLLTIAPAPDDDQEAYLQDIAAGAMATVVRVYSALSLDEKDPILLLIRSETCDAEEMMRLLKDDPRVLSATPNAPVRSLRQFEAPGK